MKDKKLVLGEQELLETKQQTQTHSGIKSMSVGVLLSLLGLLSQESKAQVSDSTVVKDSSKIEKTTTPTKTGAFSIDGAYSPTDEITTFRLAGGSSIHGVNAGGFLDLSGSDGKEGINSAFGKFTLSTSTNKIIKGSGVAVEYTLNSNAPDKIRAGILYKHKLGNGGIAFKLYPVSDKGFEPFVLVGADQKLGEKIFASAFVGSDIKSKTYYGEAEATYKVTKQIEALLQTRVGGGYTSKPKAGLYVGTRIKF